MLLFKKHGSTVFLLVLFIHCICIYFGWEMFRMLTKFLLLPLLFAWLLVNTAGHSRRAILPAFAGLIFSFLGDVLLARVGELFFLLGMLAFIGTHISYLIYFFRLNPLRLNRIKPVSVAGMLLLVVTVVVFCILNPYLGDFKMPILVYMVIISSMALSAVNTVTNPLLQRIGWSYFIPGAGLFVLSDAILAINKFQLHQPLLDIAVMLTYGAAQYFLVCGFIKIIHQNKPHGRIS